MDIYRDNVFRTKTESEKLKKKEYSKTEIHSKNQKKNPKSDSKNQNTWNITQKSQLYFFKSKILSETITENPNLKLKKNIWNIKKWQNTQIYLICTKNFSYFGYPGSQIGSGSEPRSADLKKKDLTSILVWTQNWTRTCIWIGSV